MQQITEIDVFASFAMHATELLVPWAIILITAMMALWFKDFAANFMAGIAFRYTSPFKEGDHVIVDDHDAMVIKVGITQTVFGRYTDRGYTWRYVPNMQIHNIKIEKLIRQDLHVDSDIEKGQRLQELINKAEKAYTLQANRIHHPLPTAEESTQHTHKDEGGK